jgi:hypothetical protein
MGSAFLVLGAVYHLSVSKLAAIAEAAEYGELLAMSIATPLNHPAGIAALQPEVGRRGRRGREVGCKSEPGGRDEQFHFPPPFQRTGFLADGQYALHEPDSDGESGKLKRIEI